MRDWTGKMAGRRRAAALGATAFAALAAPVMAFADPPPAAPAGQDQAAPASVDADKPQAWAVHMQSTFIEQGALPFHSPYEGRNSLIPDQGRETFDVSLYVGFRPWSGGEVWFEPEIDQGFGLADTEGVAGFVNGEGAKVGRADPYPRLPRAFFRQTIDLGGESQKVDADLSQLGGAQTADRLVLTIGKFSVDDVFDTNKYAHDPRADFLNWSLIDTGTFDYAADAWGYTYGAAGEWYVGDWTLRAGWFDLSVIPNDEKLDPSFKQFQLVGEVERRYAIAGRPGKIAVTGFLTRGRMGRFDDALALARLSGGVPNTADVRRYASRPGVSMNLEQQLTDDLGLFVRAGWADGDIEPYEYADIDQTIGAGLSLAGKRWGRPDDTVAIAGVVNSISAIHQAYLNAGGLGILVGDGRLPHPGAEQILETYYNLALFKFAHLTFDYQFIENPAYNRDRGPVSVFGLRVHLQR
jgi:high affinity Mn2+ porin